jgi:hypothetical protein
MLSTCPDELLKKQAVSQGTPGPEPRLTEKGEKAFKEWLEIQQDVGNCVYTEELGKEAARWGKRLGIDSGVGGRKWVKGFFKRNPGLAARQSQLVETCRLTGMSPPAVLLIFGIAGYALGVNESRPGGPARARVHDGLGWRVGMPPQAQAHG